MSEETRTRRLPPPAFPPNSDRGLARRARIDGRRNGDGEDGAGFPMEAFGHEEEGVATGIGDGSSAAPRDRPFQSDPALDDLVTAVTGLSDALRRKGRAALHASPGMSRFEATLRAYCVGYLAGRQGEAVR